MQVDGHYRREHSDPNTCGEDRKLSISIYISIYLKKDMVCAYISICPICARYNISKSSSSRLRFNLRDRDLCPAECTQQREAQWGEHELRVKSSVGKKFTTKYQLHQSSSLVLSGHFRQLGGSVLNYTGLQMSTACNTREINFVLQSSSYNHFTTEYRPDINCS